MICPKCGARLNRDELYCPFCRTKYDARPIGKHVKAAWLAWIDAGLAVLILVLIVMLLQW